MRFFIFTLGCKVNLCDSETIASRLISAGMDRCTKPEEADLIIINTCAVTAESESLTEEPASVAEGPDKPDETQDALPSSVDFSAFDRVTLVIFL